MDDKLARRVGIASPGDGRVRVVDVLALDEFPDPVEPAELDQRLYAYWIGIMFKQARPETLRIAAAVDTDAGEGDDDRIKRRARGRHVHRPVHGSAHVEEIPEGTPRAGRSLSLPFLEH